MKRRDKVRNSLGSRDLIKKMGILETVPKWGIMGEKVVKYNTTFKKNDCVLLAGRK